MVKSELENYLTPQQLEPALRALHPGMSITKCEYVSDVVGSLVDLEWNFFDEVHRIYVHGTYDDMFKIFSGKTFSINLVRLGRLPIFIQVANGKIRDGLFYQVMSVLSIIYCHQIVEVEQVSEGVIRLSRRWLTASHWIFRPLHFFFNRMLMRLQIKQDVEDNDLIRERRYRLRAGGFRFTTDEPDFTNSNRLNDHVKFPPGPVESRLDISSVAPAVGDKERVKVGQLELLLERKEQGFRVWPGICSHEGATLETSHLCDGSVACPWHGRKFRGGELRSDPPTKWQFLDFEVSLVRNELVVRSVNS
jgi:nitrite reductase/ring-hydroxylating ferredoxin subunit